MKSNFAGGESFLYIKIPGRLVDYCKEIGVEPVSIVSNGNKMKESFLQHHGRNIDILATSYDAFDEETNRKIGRGTSSNVQQLHRVKTWCDQYGVSFRLDTVACPLNWDGDMNQHVSQLAPSRWKYFHVLIVQGKNHSSERLRDATKFAISSEKFNHFIDNHKSHKPLIPKPNRFMAKFYLILDEYMRSLDRTGR
jgi:radical S-adenosyl methionine domain-containing protein 2